MRSRSFGSSSRQEARLAAEGRGARGEAIPQGGDWFGPSVNLASRITETARPDSVLAESAAVEAAGDGFAYRTQASTGTKGWPRRPDCSGCGGRAERVGNQATRTDRARSHIAASNATTVKTSSRPAIISRQATARLKSESAA